MSLVLSVLCPHSWHRSSFEAETNTNMISQAPNKCPATHNLHSSCLLSHLEITSHSQIENWNEVLGTLLSLETSHRAEGVQGSGLRLGSQVPPSLLRSLYSPPLLSQDLVCPWVFLWRAATRQQTPFKQQQSQGWKLISTRCQNVVGFKTESRMPREIKEDIHKRATVFLD